MVVVLVAGAVWALVLNDDDSSRTLTVAPDSLTSSDLETLLLSASDVGSGYREMERGSAEDDDEDTELEGASPECQAAIDEITPEPSGKAVHVVFQHEDDDAVVRQLLNVVREETKDLGLLRQAFEQCTGPMTRTDDNDIEYTSQLTVETLSGLGEDAFTLRDTVTDHPNITNPLEFYYVMFGRGGVYVQVMVRSGRDADESTFDHDVALPIDRDLAHELAERIDANIQQGME